MPDPTLAPSDLDEGAKKLYYKLRGYLRVEFKTWHDGDREALAQTCRWGMRARQAREALPKDKRGRPIMITQGRSESAGEVQHPLVRIAEQAERMFMDGLKELGFTPSARKRLEIDAGGKGGDDDDPFE